MTKKKTTKIIYGFLGGAWCSDEAEYPTHSVVELKAHEIKKILKYMDKLGSPGLKDVTSLSCGQGFCEWVRSSDHPQFAKDLGLSIDTVANTDESSDVAVLTSPAPDLADLAHVDRFNTRGMCEAVVTHTHVYWVGYEKYSGAKMESPVIERRTLEEWLAGKF